MADPAQAGRSRELLASWLNWYAYSRLAWRRGSDAHVRKVDLPAVLGLLTALKIRTGLASGRWRVGCRCTQSLEEHDGLDTDSEAEQATRARHPSNIR